MPERLRAVKDDPLSFSEELPLTGSAVPNSTRLLVVLFFLPYLRYPIVESMTTNHFNGYFPLFPVSRSGKIGKIRKTEPKREYMVPKRSSLERENKTLLAMLMIYCRKHHASAPKQLCPDCQQLREYAKQRLQKCPFGPEKGPCSQCKVHCYTSSMREQIQNVMRYSGPRMFRRHPILALSHLMKRWKRKSKVTK